ncbi:MAG: FeoC-like transcriptional regulator [Hyphomicrobiales bacterium]|nr:FeoC-like transcriptional regulator [Hyphomicrobiales bacterium]
MVLREVKLYLIKHRRASLTDLCNHFGAEPSAMETMLMHWVGKGRVRKHEALLTGACGSCSACGGESQRVFEWIEDAPADPVA